MKKFCSIYIHIPFCKSKCYYCDFNSYAGLSDCIGLYFECLNKEIKDLVKKLKGYKIKTIFIGGGTPSYVDVSYIYDMLDCLYNNFDIIKDAEITIEVNPGTIDYEKLSIYKKANINRLSMGLQSTNDYILKKIGRIHTYKDFLDNFRLARSVGFSNISVDLMFGIPFQTYDDWKKSLHDVSRLNPEHLSTYSLTIEPGTVFGDMYNKGEISYLDDSLDRDMYHHAIDFLREHGYNQYEISNFSKDGFCSKHNKVYWNSEIYIGLGAGAHSYFEDTRYSNVESVKDYINRIKTNDSIRENIERISKEREISDYIILRLRLVEGVNKLKFKERFGLDFDSLYKTKVEKLFCDGLITNDKIGVRLTNKGLDFANLVFVEFLD